MREFAKVRETKAGDTLVADGGFTCISEDARLVVYDDGKLYVLCDCGHHYLDGHYNEDRTEYVGLYKEAAE